MNYIAPRSEPLIREIPLSRLALAPENARKTTPGFAAFDTGRIGDEADDAAADGPASSGEDGSHLLKLQ